LISTISPRLALAGRLMRACFISESPRGRLRVSPSLRRCRTTGNRR
jgi:hypothetical protein